VDILSSWSDFNHLIKIRFWKEVIEDVDLHNKSFPALTKPI
jgi:hypothetical protein